MKPRFFLYNNCLDYADRELFKVIIEDENIAECLKSLNKEMNEMLEEPLV